MINIDYLYDPTFAKSFFGKNYFVERKLGFQVIEKGTILPHKWTAPPGKWSWGAGGIVDGNGEYVTSSFFYRSGDHNYRLPLQSVQYSSETVVYLHMFFYVWGHVITDNIRRMWFLQSEFFKKEF